MDRLAVSLSIVVALAGCVIPPKPLPSLSPPATARAQPSAPLSEKARQAKLKTLVIDVPMGHVWGEETWGYSGSCYQHQKSVNTQGRFDLDLAQYLDIFNGVMKRRGYPVEDDLELFSGTKARVADLLVAGRVVDGTLNECYPNVGTNKLQVTGSAWLKIEWSVYSTLEKKVVYATATDGSTYGEVASTMGQPGVLRPALADAVERLALDEGYRRIIDPPPAAATGAAPPTAATSRIKIRRAKEFTGGMQANVEAIRRAVATVTANRGSGSGFVVSEDGKVLTAEHVVSGSRYVKVTTGAGKECYGEVVASSKQRDLAVIALDCAGLTAIPLAKKRMAEGGEVFAIGTPLSEKLQFSVTKGVLSGIRKLEELDYLQSDVTILPGSSGGPLLDAGGSAIAVTAGGLAAGAVPIGVNFFVPLWDLEKYLPIDLTD